MWPNNLNVQGGLSRHFHHAGVLFDATRFDFVHMLRSLTRLNLLPNFLPDVHAMDHLSKQACQMDLVKVDYGLLCAVQDGGC